MSMTRRRDNRVKELGRLASRMADILKELTPDDLVKADVAVVSDQPPSTFVAFDVFESKTTNDDAQYNIRVRWDYSLFDPTLEDVPDDDWRRG